MKIGLEASQKTSLKISLNVKLGTSLKIGLEASLKSSLKTSLKTSLETSLTVDRICRAFSAQAVHQRGFPEERDGGGEQHGDVQVPDRLRSRAFHTVGAGGQVPGRPGEFTTRDIAAGTRECTACQLGGGSFTKQTH